VDGKSIEMANMQRTEIGVKCVVKQNIVSRKVDWRAAFVAVLRSGRGCSRCSCPLARRSWSGRSRVREWSLRSWRLAIGCDVESVCALLRRSVLSSKI
jgi:hypothetical protein